MIALEPDGEKGALLAMLSDRFEQLVALAGGPTKVARELSASRTTLDKWIKGESRIPLEAAVRVSALAGKPLDWLVSGNAVDAGHEPERPVMKSNPEELGDGFVIVPQLQLKASAGIGRVSEGGDLFKGDVVAFREDWLRTIGVSATRAELLTAVGDSMEPTIRDGDLLLVDRSIDRVISNGIYVLVYNGAVLVKRIVIRMDGSLILKSDNDLYGEEAISKDAAAELSIEGRVRWHGRMI